jgi:HAD superfamily hydrolase (TIGR01509 family)
MTASPHPVTAYLFDMDGVLIDSERPTLQILHELLSAAGAARDPAELRTICGRPAGTLQQFLGEWLGGDVEAVESLMGRYAAAKLEMAETDGIKAFPGTIEVLAALRERGARLAVATSTRRDSALQRLGSNGLAEYFDAIVTGDEVRNGKPAPDIFLLAAERLRADPSQCVVVEDSLAGVSAGRAAGMTVYAVAQTFEPDELGEAHRVFKDIRALHEHIRGNGVLSAAR